MDIFGSTELLYVSKVGSLFTNQRASKFGREREVNFHLHLKYHGKQIQSSSNIRPKRISVILSFSKCCTSTAHDRLMKSTQDHNIEIITRKVGYHCFFPPHFSI